MPHRSVDLQHWEVAYNAAKNPLNPDRTRLLDVYDSLLVDSHLAAAVETRVLRVLRSRYRLVGADGQPRPDLLPLLQHRWFEDFLWYAMEADFRGHTLIELGELEAPGRLKWVERINPRNVLPRQGLVVRRPLDTTGYKFREAPLHTYLIEVGRPDDLGSLSQVGPMAVLKKYALGSWSDYVHKFGIPARWVKTNSTDLRRIKQLEAIMQGMVSSSYGVFAADEEVQIMPTPGTDAHQVFDSFIARLNSEISKRLLGQDGTTDNKDASGTYGSLKVLQGVAEDRHQADKASMAYVINNDLFPRLVQLGYPLAGIRFEWDGLQDLSAGELVDAVAKLGMVFDIDPKHVEERTGIKILGARRMPGELGPEGNPGPGAGAGPRGNGKQSGKKKRSEEEGSEEEDDEDGGGVTALSGWPRETLGSCGVCGGSLDITAEGGPPPPSDDDIRAVYEDLVATDGLFSQHYFGTTADALVGGFRQSWQGNPFDYMEEPDPVAYTVMEANVFRFSAAKARHLGAEINAMVRDARGYADFKRRVDEAGTFGTYHRWLRTEYANAVNSGAQASRYYTAKRMATDLPLWEYETMEDGRVRDAHARLNKKVFWHDDKIWDVIYPPNGWRCRCSVIPRYDDGAVEVVPKDTAEPADYLKPKDMQEMAKGKFNVNRADLGVVFDEGRSYRTGQRLLFGPWENYGNDASRQTYDAINARPLPSSGQPFATEDQARTELFRGAQEVVLKDNNGKPWRWTLDNYNHHTGGKYAKQERYKTAHLVAETLSTPDEVWLMGTVKQDRPGRAEYKYIRYYEGLTMVVEARATLRTDGDHRMDVYTWHESTSDSIGKHRLGHLLKKNAR